MTLTRSLMLAAILGATMVSNQLMAKEKVALTVSLEGIQVGHAPLYISVQDANQFRTNDGAAGTILRSQEQQDMTVE
ncbi:MAG: hypothetical protein V2I33_03435, partial [Kangiellaceae bacterium]|nr:hypothetical protein [Kangiellaceae bacterium]